MPHRYEGKRVKSGLGKALVNKKNKARRSTQPSANTSQVHSTDFDGEATTRSTDAKLGSVIDRNELDDFLATAIAKEQKFNDDTRQTLILIGTTNTAAAAAAYQAAAATGAPPSSSGGDAAARSSVDVPVIVQATRTESL